MGYSKADHLKNIPTSFKKGNGANLKKCKCEQSVKKGRQQK
jgi:hypothetical protein